MSKWNISRAQNVSGGIAHTVTDGDTGRVYRAYLDANHDIVRLTNITNKDKHRELDPRGHTAYLIKSAMRKRVRNTWKGTP